MLLVNYGATFGEKRGIQRDTDIIRIICSKFLQYKDLFEKLRVNEKETKAQV